jgi:uncharacterized protein YdbL (DUF1318 family)
MKQAPWILMPIAALVAQPVAAQAPLLGQAIRAGQAGERYDGYMGTIGTPSPELRRQVAAINIRRRNLYIELASRRNVTPELVGMATACQLFQQLPVGEAFMLDDRVWRRRAAGQAVPLPDYCR